MLCKVKVVGGGSRLVKRQEREAARPAERGRMGCLGTGNIDSAGVRSSKIKAREPTDDLPPLLFSLRTRLPFPPGLARKSYSAVPEVCPPSQVLGNHRRFWRWGVSRKKHKEWISTQGHPWSSAARRSMRDCLCPKKYHRITQSYSCRPPPTR